MGDDDILSVENGWRLHLDEYYGDNLTAGEKREIARHYTRLEPKPSTLEADRALLRRYKQCGGDIVHGWQDDPNDFSMWKDVFKLLAPPDDSPQAD